MEHRPKTLLTLTILIFLALSMDEIAAAESPSIGTVQKVSGTAAVIRGGQTFPAKTGQEIQVTDTLRTGTDGSIGVVFADETVLSLGPGSTLGIDEFLYAPRQGKFSIVFKMMKGTAVYLSGLIAKLAPDAVHFVTPSASVGVRGTKFAVKVDDR